LRRKSDSGGVGGFNCQTRPPFPGSLAPGRSPPPHTPPLTPTFPTPGLFASRSGDKKRDRMISHTPGPLLGLTSAFMVCTHSLVVLFGNEFKTKNKQKVVDGGNQPKNAVHVQNEKSSRRGAPKPKNRMQLQTVTFSALLSIWSSVSHPRVDGGEIRESFLGSPFPPPSCPHLDCASNICLKNFTSNTPSSFLRKD